MWKSFFKKTLDMIKITSPILFMSGIKIPKPALLFVLKKFWMNFVVTKNKDVTLTQNHL